MTAALPSLVDGVEKIATDAAATHHDRIAAFKALAEKVFPANGWDHVGHQVNAEGARDHQQELVDLLRHSRADFTEGTAAALVDEYGYSRENAERLIDLWFRLDRAFLGSEVDELRQLVQDQWNVEPPPPEVVDDDADADVVPFRAIEATATEEALSPDPVMSELVDELARKGWTLAEALALVRGDEIDDGGDGGD
jgi:hypothetical protein